MHSKSINTVIAAGIFLGLAGSLTADESFIEPAFGARFMAAGRSSAGFYKDPMYLYWNPAILPDIPHQEASVQYTRLSYGDYVRFQFAAPNFAIGYIGADATDPYSATTQANVYYISTAYVLTPQISVGAKGKLWNATESGTDQSILGLDAGVLIKPYPFLYGEATLLNLATIRSGSAGQVPQEYRVGGGIQIGETPVLLFGNANFAQGRTARYQIGTEVRPLSYLPVRAGYETQNKEVFGGIGFELQPATLDVSVGRQLALSVQVSLNPDKWKWQIPKTPPKTQLTPLKTPEPTLRKETERPDFTLTLSATPLTLTAAKESTMFSIHEAHLLDSTASIKSPVFIPVTPSLISLAIDKKATDYGLTLKVRAADGTLIKQLWEGNPVSEGNYQLTWDGATDAQTVVMPGAYHTMAEVRKGKQLAIQTVPVTAIWPNHPSTPFTQSLEFNGLDEFRYQLNGAPWNSYLVTAFIRTDTGRLVRTVFTYVPYPSGTFSVRWDGKNDAGKPMPPGQYQLGVIATASDLISKQIQKQITWSGPGPVGPPVSPPLKVFVRTSSSDAPIRLTIIQKVSEPILLNLWAVSQSGKIIHPIITNEWTVAGTRTIPSGWATTLIKQAKEPLTLIVFAATASHVQSDSISIVP